MSGICAPAFPRQSEIPARRVGDSNELERLVVEGPPGLAVTGLLR